MEARSKVLCEVWDWDARGNPDFMGRATLPGKRLMQLRVHGVARECLQLHVEPTRVRQGQIISVLQSVAVKEQRALRCRERARAD